MAYYFVQQYWVLPNIGEALETPTSAGAPSSSQSLEASTFGRQNLSSRGPSQGKIRYEAHSSKSGFKRSLNRDRLTEFPKFTRLSIYIRQSASIINE